ncbi:MAG TPA: ammonium transporter [Elusimicrobiota bacterium]|jgi:Amt family ammonium transporter|nr:ammonium transporter [Elusimicrobiota bacterium]
MRKNKPEWWVALGLLAAAAACGVLSRQAPAPASGAAPAVAGDVAWMLTASGLVLLMTPGLSFFYGGMVQRKNVLSTMLQSFIAMGVVSVLWVWFGFGLAFGDSVGGVIGNPASFLMFRGVGLSTNAVLAPTIPLALFAFFQLKFAIITPALITGSFAERVRFSSYMLFMALFLIFVYCPVAHWTWHPDGFLHKWGVLDFAGGAVVHMTAGFAALAGASFMGRRKAHVEGYPHVPANIAFVLLGTGMLWFGWFGFNAGSALAANESAVQAFMTTHTASAAAMLGWVFFDAVRGRRPSAMGAAIGAVVGLVAITPAAGYVSIGDSLFIGVAASMISNVAVHWKSRSTLDDTLDVFPCHGVGGITGMLLTAVFAQKGGLVNGDPTLFLYHCAAVAIVGGYSFLVSYALFYATDAAITLRVRPEQEEAGLDLSQHAESLPAA